MYVVFDYSVSKGRNFYVPTKWLAKALVDFLFMYNEPRGKCVTWDYLSLADHKRYNR